MQKIFVIIAVGTLALTFAGQTAICLGAGGDMGLGTEPATG